MENSMQVRSTSMNFKDMKDNIIMVSKKGTVNFLLAKRNT